MIALTKLTVEHTQDIVECLRELRVESPEYNYVDDDPEFVFSNLHALISADHMVGVVAYVNGCIVGFMIGFVSNPWYSKRVEAMEQLLYVDPAVRGGTTAVRLIKEFEEVCRQRGAVVLSAGASTGIHEDRTVKLYERMGYTQGSPTLRKVL